MMPTPLEDTYYAIAERHALPDAPGVYRFYDAGHTCIYVGKAKRLKRRVASYFTKQDSHPIKTRKMVGRIHSIGFTLVNSEYEALLLENNLIKEYQPLYNVLLKDGKTYPYLCLTDERFPRLITTRQRTPSLGTYFGPFTSSQTLEQVETLIRELYPLRICKYDLSERNIAKGKFKVCLAYHLGNCRAPCVGKEQEEQYMATIEAVTHLLKGNFQAVKRDLKAKMQDAAATMAFEEAQHYKEKLAALGRYQARSLITNTRGGTLDVIAMVDDPMRAFVSYLHLQQGRITFATSITLHRQLDEQGAELMARVLAHFRGVAGSDAKEILANEELYPLPTDAVLTLPKMGDKRKLVDLALKNAFFHKKEQLHKQAQTERTRRTPLIQLQQDLRMRHIPMHIECFDNAHLQGSYPVASMVCFKRGKPAKRAYRHYHLTTTAFADDFAFMGEVVRRRYHRLQKEGKPLPDLVVVDGGKGQLAAATAALEALGLYGKIAIVGLAKRLEAVYFPGDPDPYYISKKSPSLQLLQQVRNEAHRFANTFHRTTRSRHALESLLHGIPGVGPKRMERLLHTFKSVKGIQGATHEALTACVGNHLATTLHAHLGAATGQGEGV